MALPIVGWERNGFRPQINGKTYVGWSRKEIDIYLPNMVHPDQIPTVGLSDDEIMDIIRSENDE